MLLFREPPGGPPRTPPRRQQCSFANRSPAFQLKGRNCYTCSHTGCLPLPSLENGISHFLLGSFSYSSAYATLGSLPFAGKNLAFALEKEE